MIKTIILARHGRTEWNAQGRFQGHEGAELDAKGREQAVRLSECLNEMGLEIDRVVSSDLLRAQQTASVVADPRHLEVYPDKRFRECCLGTLEGLTHDEVRVRYGEVALTTHLRRVDDPHQYDLRPYGGECHQQVLKRQVELLNCEYASQHATILFVGHGKSINTLLHALWPQEKFIKDNCEFRIVTMANPL